MKTNIESNFFPSILFLLFLLCGGFSSASSISPSNAKPNVLLITIDSLRPDHIGAYGYPLPTTPYIDKIAGEGTLFKNAISQGGWTSPAMVSIFTSIYPSVHGVETRPDYFPCSKNSLLEKWVQAGYKVPGAKKVIEENNFSHLGFQIQEDYSFDLNSLKNWIKENRSSPFFIWYHINQTPHLPYNPKKPYDTLFLRKDFSITPAIKKTLEYVKSNAIIPKGSIEFQNEDIIVPIMALYDGEVRMADEAVHKIYTFLAEENLLDNTILIITADHGEELMDHGFIGHASTNHDGTLYEEIIRVPLIFRYPSALPENKIVEKIVESIDIMPTLMEIAGIPGNKWIQGRSLLNLIQGKKPSWKNYTFSENSPCGFQCKAEDLADNVKIVSIRSKQWKFIARQGQKISTFELYDLQKDPEEKKNLILEHPVTAGVYKEILLNWYYKNGILRKALYMNCFNRTN